MPKTTPEPDEFGRIRVTDKDTGHRRTIRAADVHLGNYNVLQQPASDPVTGDPLPPEYGAIKPQSTNSGQQADTKKESKDG